MKRYETTRPVSIDGVAYGDGEPLSHAVPQGCIASCLRMGYVRELCEPQPARETKKPEKQPETERPVVDSDPDSDVFRATPISVLELPKQITEALAAAELESVAQVVDFGNAHQGLTSIKGIGDKAEALVTEALDSLLAKQAG